MDIGKAFSFVTEDEHWMGKIGIGALVSLFSLLLIPIPLLVGYAVGVARNVRAGVPYPLPEWDDWGRLFKDGLFVLVAQWVYTLPFWLLSCVMLVGVVGMGSLANYNEDLATAGLFSTVGLTLCLVLIFVVALFFISPAIVIQYVRSDDFGAMFRIGEVFGIAKDNIGNIVLVALVTFGVSLALNIVLGLIGIIPCIGEIIDLVIALAAVPYIIALTGHLYGQMAE